jgi:O-acetyl-ADP-ribose deacetylase (regulator of RNase III)
VTLAELLSAVQALSRADKLRVFQFLGNEITREKGVDPLSAQATPSQGQDTTARRSISYLKGDATRPQAPGNKILAHVCNDLGLWGKGFVLAVSRRWEKPKEEFQRWYQGRASNDFGLGAVQVVQVEPDLWVANMIAQRGTRTRGTRIQYDNLKRCLARVREKARELSASVHMPRIGAGLAGGDWTEIEPIIQAELCAAGVAVFVYDFEEKK